MTSTTDQTTTAPQLSAIPGGDPRPYFAAAAATAREVVAGITPEQLRLPTPCAEWSTRDLLDHVLGAVERMTLAGRREPIPPEVASHPDLADGDWTAAITAALAAATEAWSDESRLTEMVDLPWASMPGFAVVATYTGELTTHAWDLAAATGQQIEWNQGTAEFAYRAIEPHFQAFESAGTDRNDMADMPFDRAVEVPAEAPAIDRLVALCGRNP